MGNLPDNETGGDRHSAEVEDRGASRRRDLEIGVSKVRICASRFCSTTNT